MTTYAWLGLGAQQWIKANPTSLTHCMVKFNIFFKRFATHNKR